MYCSRCGRVLNDKNTHSICEKCAANENKKAEEIALFLNANNTPSTPSKDEKYKLFIILLGVLCPIILIIYFWKSLEKWSGADCLSTTNRVPAKSTVNDEDSVTEDYDYATKEKKFVFVGGDGNLYESGGLFRDWSGNLVEWGGPFRDSRGNLVAWGEPFYDNRDNISTWGNPFYDAGDNLVDPR